MVSVILPNYRHQRFLKARIDSILNQNYTDFELIILDDASTDGSQEIINSYSNHAKVSHIVINEKNSGSTFNQWQKGIKLAKGKYIWIAESDDIAKPEFLNTHIQFLEKNTEYGVSFSPSIWIDQNNKEIHVPGHENTSLSESQNELIINEFTKGPIIYNASSAVFKKDLVKHVDFNILKNFTYCGDWYFWFKLGEQTKFFRQKERLNYFRRHDQNVSFGAEKKGLHILEGSKIIKEIINKYPIPFLKRLKLQYFWLKKTNTLGQLKHINFIFN